MKTPATLVGSLSFTDQWLAHRSRTKTQVTGVNHKNFELQRILMSSMSKKVHLKQSAMSLCVLTASSKSKCFFINLAQY